MTPSVTYPTSVVWYWGMTEAAARAFSGIDTTHLPIDTEADLIAACMHLHNNPGTHFVWYAGEQGTPEFYAVLGRIMYWFDAGQDGGAVPLSSAEFRRLGSQVYQRDVIPEDRVAWLRWLTVLEDLHGPE